MAAPRVRPQTLEEKVVYWTIAGSWGLWLVGGLYIASPVVGWLLLAVSVARMLGLRDDGPAYVSVPAGVWVWAAGMLVLLVALIMGHLDYGLGAAKTLKSFMGWMKGWALMAVFIFVGATMRIRPAVIYRATCLLGAQTLILTPLFVLAALLSLPRVLYVSPLLLIGGPGPEFFNVELYGIEPTTGKPRWRFFAPWAPAAGIIASMGFIFALYERDRMWKVIGLLAALVVAALSQTRMAMIAIPAISILLLVATNLTRTWPWAAGALVCIAALPFVGPIIQIVEDAQSAFTGARAASSRVRATLQSIAVHRWGSEAPIWGHGIVERGPHLVEYMPIGSHHTWNGLLFVKGIVGYVALALPLAWSSAEILAKAQADRVARAGLAILLLLLLFSFGENLEILIYLVWPGLLIVGIATRRRFMSPLRSPLSRRGHASSPSTRRAWLLWPAAAG